MLFSSLPPGDCFDELCLVNFVVNVGRILFNDSALRWINDLALFSTVFETDAALTGSTLAATDVLGGTFGVG